MPRKPRRSPEESYRVRKHNDLLRSRDPKWSMWIDGDDYQKFRQHIIDLHEYITYAEMARRAGIPDSSVYTHIQKTGRTHGRVHRDTYNAVMSLRLTEEEKITRYDRRRGAHRIIQGLIARGFNHQAIAEVVGSNRQSVANLACKHSKSWDGVSPELYNNFLLAADKLETADPLDYGCKPVGVAINLTTSRRKGWATISAWDLETIHREDAFPEWTGACGTEQGYRIHLRESIDVCGPCKRAVGYDGRKAIFSGWKFKNLIEERGLQISDLAPKIGVAEETVNSWANGANIPQTRHHQNILDALGVEREEIFEVPERDYIHDTDFNRHKLKLAMDEAGIGMHVLSKGSGVSHTALHNWVSGKKIPKIDNVCKVAKYFNVDWKVFYE